MTGAYQTPVHRFGTPSQCCGSGSVGIRKKLFRIRNKFEAKLINLTNSHQKCPIYYYEFLFIKKNSLENLYPVIIYLQSNTLKRREYKSKIYVNKIRKNSCRIRFRIWIRNQLKSRIRILIRKKSLRMHNTAPNQCCVSPSASQLKDKVLLVQAMSVPVPTGNGNGSC